MNELPESFEQPCKFVRRDVIKNFELAFGWRCFQDAWIEEDSHEFVLALRHMGDPLVSDWKYVLDGTCRVPVSSPQGDNGFLDFGPDYTHRFRTYFPGIKKPLVPDWMTEEGLKKLQDAELMKIIRNHRQQGQL